MYFKKSDIKKAKEYVTARCEKLNVIMGVKDEARFNTAIGNMLKQKSYYEGEQIDPKHTAVLKSNINIVIGNLSDYLVKNADELKGKIDISNPVEYLITAVDAFYILAMEQLGCPNMPIILFDADIKKTITQSAMEIHRSFVTFDISKGDTFDRQRGKDAAEVSREFGLIADGIKKGKKAESVGKLVAEYQALKERQKNHNAFWRLFHRTENKNRNALIEKMGKFIRDQLPEGMKGINLDEAVPGFVSSNIADARIRGEVELAGAKRLDGKALLKLYGCAPSEEHIADQKQIIDEISQKVSMSKDEKFLNDVMGTDNIKMNQVPKEKVITNLNLAKD